MPPLLEQLLPYAGRLQRLWSDINASLYAEDVRRFASAVTQTLKLGLEWGVAIRQQYSAKLGWPLALTLECLIATGLIFALVPDLDLLASRRLFVNGDFIGRGPMGNILRILGWLVPFAVLTAAIACWLGLLLSDNWSRLSSRLPALQHLPPPNLSMGLRTKFLKWVGGLRIAFLALSMVLGPGVLVNGILKDHWHRPRPAQVIEFGGTNQFQPWWSRRGTCDRNCSFVSGEASSATWLLAPALLVPPPFQPIAVAAALMFAIAVGRLRMAFGGHFLSDTLMSILLTALIILLLHRWLVVNRSVSGGGPQDSRLPEQ